MVFALYSYIGKINRIQTYRKKMIRRISYPRVSVHLPGHPGMIYKNTNLYFVLLPPACLLLTICQRLTHLRWH